MVSGAARQIVLGDMRINIGDILAPLQNGGNKGREEIVLRAICPTGHDLTPNGGRPTVRCRWTSGLYMILEWGQKGCREIVGIYSGGVGTWEGG